jgi:hypothetical protein
VAKLRGDSAPASTRSLAGLRERRRYGGVLKGERGTIPKKSVGSM